MEKDPFKEYLRESEPDKAHKGYAWSTAIGLQAVDGLKPSKYLIDIAIQNIEGKITMKEAQSLIDSYYEERPVHLSDDERTEEADKVSSRIAEILSETAFSFSPNEYISIHRKLFQGYGKFISSGKAIREQQQCSSSNIQGHLGFLQPMIFLRKMRGISEMHLCVQTIRICKKVFTKQQSIWKRFSEIYF